MTLSTTFRRRPSVLDALASAARAFLRALPWLYLPPAVAADEDHIRDWKIGHRAFPAMIALVASGHDFVLFPFSLDARLAFSHMISIQKLDSSEQREPRCPDEHPRCSR